MDNIASLGRGQIGGGYQAEGSDNLAGGSLLTQLEQRVNATLGQPDQKIGGSAGAAAQAINPQDVVSYMAQISGPSNPIPGMTCGALV